LETEQHKSAITDHLTQQNVIDWDEATVIGGECARSKQWIRKAIRIRRESQGVMNRGKGATS